MYDFSQQDNLTYIVMQYVEAGTLKEMLGRPLDLKLAADVVEQVAGALDYAHEQGIIHRDVKPGNVLMGVVFGLDKALKAHSTGEPRQHCH